MYLAFDQLTGRLFIVVGGGLGTVLARSRHGLGAVSTLSKLFAFRAEKRGSSSKMRSSWRVLVFLTNLRRFLVPPHCRGWFLPY